jgi:5-methylthioadenosine/S-adenosylhomocysteine deaminase
MTRLVIRNCSVLVVPETGECRVDDGQDIHVEDGAITAIAAAGTMQSAPETEVLDATGLIAVPGLTNSHTHSPMVMMRGAAEDVSIDDWFNRRIWPMEVNLTPERVRVGARLACAEMLLAGTTTFVDHYFHAEQIAAAALESGIRADLAPTFFSSTGSEGREAALTSARQIRALNIAAAATQNQPNHPSTPNHPGRSEQRHHGGKSAQPSLVPQAPRVTASLGPHATYTVTEEDLQLTAEVARAEGFRIHLHAAETEEQTQSSQERLGATPIEVLGRTGVLDAGVLIAHGCGIVDADLPLLARYADRTAVACCPKVYLKLAMGSTTPIKALQAAGVAVGVGTDGAAVHNTLDVWEALRLVALTQKERERDAEWMTISDTLRLATRGGAAAAGLAELTGAIEVGRRADVTLVDLAGPHCQPVHDPRAALVYSVRAADVVTVLVDGEIVVRNRQLTKVDLAGIVAEAKDLAHTLVDLSAGGTVQHYAP